MTTTRGRAERRLVAFLTNPDRPESGQRLTVNRTFRQAYERKGYHYGVFDTLVRGEDGRHLGRIRHTPIFQVATRGGGS